MLIAPPRLIASWARSARASIGDATYSSTLLSKKSPGIRLVSIELEIGGHPSAEFLQDRQSLTPPLLLRHDFERSVRCRPKLDIVAFLEVQRTGDVGGDADRQAVAPF